MRKLGLFSLERGLRGEKVLSSTIIEGWDLHFSSMHRKRMRSCGRKVPEGKFQLGKKNQSKVVGLWNRLPRKHWKRPWPTSSDLKMLYLRCNTAESRWLDGWVRSPRCASTGSFQHKLFYDSIIMISQRKMLGNQEQEGAKLPEFRFPYPRFSARNTNVLGCRPPFLTQWAWKGSEHTTLQKALDF